MKGSKRSHVGFTLVELLIVVIILAILAAIVVPQFGDSTQEARESSLDSTLANMRSAIDLYRQQHAAYPGANTAVPAAGCAAPATSGSGTGGAGAQGVTAFTEQMTLYTDINGAACSVGDDTTFRFGPYLQSSDAELPENPITELNTLVVVSNGDLLMTSATDPGAGWQYDILTGKFIADDVDFADR